jgi:hypothetical protein
MMTEGAEMPPSSQRGVSVEIKQVNWAALIVSLLLALHGFGQPGCRLSEHLVDVDTGDGQAGLLA